MPSLIIIAIAVLVVLSLLANMWFTMALKRQRRQLQEAHQKVDELSSTVSGLCSAAVGVDKRVIRLEQKGRDLEHRQESFETQKHSDRPYGEAIQLVHRGATASRLVEELGLSHSEAELVVMLHSMEKTG